MKVALLTTDNREHCKDYAAATPYFGTAPQGLIDGFSMLGGDLEVHVVSCLQQEPISSPEKLAPNVWYHALHVPKIGWLRTGYQGCVRAARRKLAEIQPDIVHGQGTERDCALSAVLSGYPNVLTIHGNMRLITAMFPPKLFSANWFTAKLEGWTIPRSDGVVAITTYTQRAVEDLARKIWLLPNAVDWSFADANVGKSTPPSILVVAGVDQRKNQNAFIDALVPLAEKMKFSVKFLGVVHRESDYGREFLARLEKYPWCQYEGMVDRDGLRAYFTQANLLVLPTREDNCPMVVLEAMAAGVPVVASQVGGIPDLIRDGKTGLFCDPESAASMRDAVEKLLTDTTLAARLVENGKIEARDRFHPRVIAARHVEIYREVLASRR